LLCEETKHLQTKAIILKIDIHKTALKPQHTIQFRVPVGGERQGDINIPLRAFVPIVFANAPAQRLPTFEFSAFKRLDTGLRSVQTES
jgi:hypothetical protein